MFLRLPQNYFAKPFAILLVGEAAILFAAFYLGTFGRWGPSVDVRALFLNHFWDAAIYATAGVSSLFAMGLYHGRNSTRFFDVFIRTILSLGLTFVVLSVLFYVWPTLAVWRSTLAIALPVSLIGIFLLRYLFLRLIGTDLIARRVLVLGTGAHAAEIEDLEGSSESCGMKCVGFLDVEGGTARVSVARIIKNALPLLDLCQNRQVSEIVVAVQERRGMLPVEELLDCKLSGIPIYGTILWHLAPRYPQP